MALLLHLRAVAAAVFSFLMALRGLAPTLRLPFVASLLVVVFSALVSVFSLLLLCAVASSILSLVFSSYLQFHSSLFFLSRFPCFNEWFHAVLEHSFREG